jgi:hypothetical protein
MVATYRIYVECDYCGKIHPLPFAVSIDDIPPGTKSVAEIYGDKKLPENVNSIISIPVHCSEVEEYFVQKENKKILLIPV